MSIWGEKLLSLSSAEVLVWVSVTVPPPCIKNSLKRKEHILQSWQGVFWLPDLRVTQLFFGGESLNSALLCFLFGKSLPKLFTFWKTSAAGPREASTARQLFSPSLSRFTVPHVFHLCACYLPSGHKSLGQNRIIHNLEGVLISKPHMRGRWTISWRGFSTEPHRYHLYWAVVPMSRGQGLPK